jgi:hypothetical protein
MFDIGQGAHGELEAIGQIGAGAKAQCDAPTHDVVAEALQGILIHGPIMTLRGGNVELSRHSVSI